MRVLLDENLDWRLVRHFDADFQVTTVSRQGWKGTRNSELLQQAEAAFDVLVTFYITTIGEVPISCQKRM